MQLTKLLFIDVANIPAQVRFPFVINMEPNAIVQFKEAIRERITTEKFDGTDELELLQRAIEAGVVQDLIDVSATAETVMPEGMSDWNDKRFYFLAEVVLEPTSRYNQAETVALVGGYTDHAVISQHNQLDPNMKMYITSVTTYRNVKLNDGAVTRPISDTLVALDNQNKDSAVMMRPYDVFCKLESEVDMSINPDDVVNLVDTRSSFHSGLHLMRRNNNNSVDYGMTLCNVSLDAANAADCNEPLSDFITDTREVIACEHTRLSSRDDAFIRALCAQDREFKYSGYVDLTTFADLMSLTYAQMDELTTIAQMSDHDTSEFSEWTDGTLEAKLAYVVCQTLPSLLVINNVGGVSLSATNINGDPAAVISDVISLSGVDNKSSELDTLTNLIEKGVVSAISNQNHIMVDLDVECNLHGFTDVTIRLDNDEPMRYRYTNFTGSMTNPQIGTSEGLSDIADHLKTLQVVMDEVLKTTEVPDINTDDLH